mmetsp:Transcript_7081/g.13103  ORF Transcript_7081/g.13103 Transcript_7081/m.13103 type:complete len:240 (-) Transcript_7081:201-920(-)
MQNKDRYCYNVFGGDTLGGCRCGCRCYSRSSSCCGRFNDDDIREFRFVHSPSSAPYGCCEDFDECQYDGQKDCCWSNCGLANHLCIMHQWMFCCRDTSGEPDGHEPHYVRFATRVCCIVCYPCLFVPADICLSFGIVFCNTRPVAMEPRCCCGTRRCDWSCNPSKPGWSRPEARQSHSNVKHSKYHAHDPSLDVRTMHRGEDAQTVQSDETVTTYHQQHHQQTGQDLPNLTPDKHNSDP